MNKIVILLAVLGLFVAMGFVEKTRSANLSSVSVTLSTPRLSFVGKLDAGNSAGSSTVTIVTTPGQASSITTEELAEGDVVMIGDAGNGQLYTVASSSQDPATFDIRAPDFGTLQAGNDDAGDAVIATRSGEVRVAFTTASAIANGSFQILVPATTLSGVGGDADGIPDQDGFDFGATAPTVTCPTDVGDTFDFVTGTATSSAVTLAGVPYHAYECKYSGNGAASVAFDGVSEEEIVISNLINPSPKVGHVQGNSDPYQFMVRNLDSTGEAVDSTIVTVGNVEAVRVIAVVPSQITFGVTGINSGASTCGQTTSATTTDTTVPFGTVSLTSFSHASQNLEVSTNAINGYAVTISANDQLGKDGNACVGDPPAGNTCVPDAQVVGMSETTSQDWTSTSDTGLAYSLQNVSGTATQAFSYNESGRSFSARHLPDNEAGQTAQTIFSAAAPAANHNVYVCYRVIVGTNLSLGNYSNTVTYRATASF